MFKKQSLERLQRIVLKSWMMMMNNCNSSTIRFIAKLEKPYCVLPPWVLNLQVSYLALNVTLSAVGNGFVLFLILRNKTLRYRSILVTLSCVLTDSLLVLLFHLPALVSAATREWPLGEVGCKVLGLVGFYLVYVRWISMATIALDRFCFISFPMSYARWSKPYLIVLTVLAWGVPLLMQVPSMVGVGMYSFRPGFSNCFIDCGTDRVCYGVYAASISVQFVVGAFLPTGLYTIMYIFSRFKKRRIRMGSQLNISQRSSQLPQWHWSNRDIRALTTFLLVLITIMATNVPVYVLLLLRRPYTELYQQIPLWVHMIITDLFYASSFLNPLLIMRTREFRRATSRLFLSNPSAMWASIMASTVRQERNTDATTNIDTMTTTDPGCPL